jgi:hypothetical protein
MFLDSIRIIASNPEWKASDILIDSDNTEKIDMGISEYIYVLSPLPASFDELFTWINNSASENNSFDHLWRDIQLILQESSVNQIVSRNHLKLIWVDFPSVSYHDPIILKNIKSLFSEHNIDNYTEFPASHSKDITVNMKIDLKQKNLNYVFRSHGDSKVR